MVTVAVLAIPDKMVMDIPDRDLEIKTQGGHGPGGQHQNKTDSAVRIKHKPTGLQVFINGRSQKANKIEAKKVISARVSEHYQEQSDKTYGKNRKNQHGGGGRSNKVRTYNFLESRAVDHRLGTKSGQVKQIISRGRFDLLIGNQNE
jgi:peptide chain release factor 1